MKQLFTLLLSGLLLILTGCAQTQTPVSDDSAPQVNLLSNTADPLSDTADSSSGTADIPSAGFVVNPEWPAYDPAIGQIWFTIQNTSDTTLFTGVDYQLEYQKDGVWQSLVSLHDCWIALGLSIEPGESITLCCHLDAWENAGQPGTYRITKTIGDETASGTFQLEEGAAIAPDRPCGFPTLESLPLDYDLSRAAADGCIVFPDTEPVQNLDAFGTFLTKVQLGIPCQIRMAWGSSTGAPILEDVSYEEIGGAGRFAWRRDARRDGVDTISETWYYSYLTVGEKPHTVSWDETGRKTESPRMPTIRLGNSVNASDGPLDLLTGDAAAPYVDTVQAMAAEAMEGNSTRTQVWSPDGTHNAILTEEPLEFGWGGAGYGEIQSLADYDGLDVKIEGIGWEDDHTLNLTVRQTAGPDGSTPAYLYQWDIETKQLTRTGVQTHARSLVNPRW